MNGPVEVAAGVLAQVENIEPGSVIFLQGADFLPNDPDGEEGMRMFCQEISNVCGHDRFIAVSLDAASRVLVVEPEEALDALADKIAERLASRGAAGWQGRR